MLLQEGTAASTSSSHASELQSPTAAATSRVGDAGGGVRPSGLPPVPTVMTTPTASYSSLAASGAAAYAVMLQGFSRGVVPSFSPGGLLGTAGSGVSLPSVQQQQQQDAADTAEVLPKLSLGLTRSQSVPALESLGGGGAVATSTGTSSHPQVVLSHQVREGHKPAGRSI